MKRLLSWIGTGIVCLAAVGLLFAMPADFVLSSWHLSKVDATTRGKVLESRTVRNKGLEGSRVRYTYEVDGKSYTSDRIEAGYLDNRGFQSGGGAFALRHRAGSSVTVYYDSADPGFSLLISGWPKWSVAFSMAVWGFVLSACFPLRSFRSFWSGLAYAASRGVVLAGFISFPLMPVTMAKPEFLLLASVWLVFSVVAFFYGIFAKETPDPKTLNIS